MFPKHGIMAGSKSFSTTISASDEFINRFNDTLFKIDPGLPLLIDFKLNVQKKNLMSLFINMFCYGTGVEVTVKRGQ